MTLTLGFSAAVLYVLIGVAIFILSLDFLASSAEAQETGRGTLARLSFVIAAAWPLSMPIFSVLVIFHTLTARD